MEFVEGQTPLDPDEEAELIPSLTTRAQLNAFEQRNIVAGLVWARRSRILSSDLLSMDSLLLLHRRMFDETWRWAGEIRKTGKNIGVEPHQIRPRLAQLCGDCKFWIESETYPLGECAVRFHHKLVLIHLFANGNGRHARMVADLLMYYNKRPPFTWGGASLDAEGATRQRYLAALRKADRGRYDLLLSFATE